MGKLTAGITGTAEVVVTSAHTAVKLGSGEVEVFATPALVALMEEAALKSVQPYLPAGSGTVGISISIRHTAATPVGMRVTARSELVAIDGRRLVFEVFARDEVEQVGEGVHERFIVDLGKFTHRAEKKGRSSSGQPDNGGAAS